MITNQLDINKNTKQLSDSKLNYKRNFEKKPESLNIIKHFKNYMGIKIV